MHSVADKGPEAMHEPSLCWVLTTSHGLTMIDVPMCRHRQMLHWHALIMGWRARGATVAATGGSLAGSKEHSGKCKIVGTDCGKHPAVTGLGTSQGAPRTTLPHRWSPDLPLVSWQRIACGNQLMAGLCSGS